MEHSPIPLREVQVRSVRPDEEPRFDALMRTHHYLGFRNYCGNRLLWWKACLLAVGATGEGP
ncbi:MAG: hypothetical protein OXN89_26805, partial [Bryobacterales bacterium]|nr:hypothetical protein [Bryobacterales bacterium]